MRKKMRSFRQHTKETCGAACILMLLDYYRKVRYPTQKMEHKLYAIYRSRAFRGMPGSYAADCLSRNGLQVQLLHSAKDYMENQDDYYEEPLFHALHQEYKTRAAACAERVELRTGMFLDCGTLKALLAEGKTLMVQCIVPGNADGIHTHTLHWIVVYGWEAGEFLTCDPCYGKYRIPEADMETYMDTPIGRIFLTVRQEK